MKPSVIYGEPIEWPWSGDDGIMSYVKDDEEYLPGCGEDDEELAVIAGKVSMISAFLAYQFMEIDPEDNAMEEKLIDAEALLWGLYERSQANANALYEFWSDCVSLDGGLTVQRASELLTGFVLEWNECEAEDKAAAETAQAIVREYFPS